MVFWYYKEPAERTQYAAILDYGEQQTTYGQPGIRLGPDAIARSRMPRVDNVNDSSYDT
jgi:hypothetical protein